jgi:hypothetical protein
MSKPGNLGITDFRIRATAPGPKRTVGTAAEREIRDKIRDKKFVRSEEFKQIKEDFLASEKSNITSKPKVSRSQRGEENEAGE